MAFRDANVIIIETARTYVRVGIGLNELLRIPAFDFPARVGLRRSATTELVDGRAKKRSIGPRRSSLPQFKDPKAQPHDYLVGTQLEEAIAAGQDIIVSWPFADNDVFDMTQAEALWKYALFRQLQRRRTQMESPVILSIANGLSRATYESISQIFFERFNSAGLAILERPIGQLYAANGLSGIVVDIGQEKTDITPIYEGYINHSAVVTTDVGINDCHHYLAQILRSNQSVMSTLSSPDAPLDPATLQITLLALVHQIYDEGLIKVPSDGETAIPDDDGITDIAAILVAGKEKAVIESGMKKKATIRASATEQARAREKEAMDLVTVEFQGKSLTLGKERHRFCEPLFDPTLLEGILGHKTKSLDEKPVPLQDAVALAINQTEIDQRQYIWGGLFVTGDVTRYVKGMAVALQSRLSLFLNSTELQTDLQARTIRILNIPEYYPEYRDTGNQYAAFLGASITAKIIFNDNGTRSYVSKADYGAKGPHAIIEMSPSLL